MNIIILQGPNLNLLGLKSSQLNKKLTLDKLNRAVKNHIRNTNNKLKFLQTHKEFQAINFLQRNRNWADGLLFVPTSWAKNNYTILETINLIQIKTALVFFETDYSFGATEKDSIFKGKSFNSFTGSPIESCINGLTFLTKK
tara:strand:+ start:1269 stop:1694 length:426 start_codon:yes stop_codon:yes gene_type:complete